MKKLVLCVVAGLLMASQVWATPLQVMDYRPPGVGVTMKMATVNTMLSAVTATGLGSAVDLGTYVSRFTCAVVWGGTAPTNTVTELFGSIDGTSYVSLTGAHTSTASPDMFHVADKPVRWIKGKYTSKTDGDATTSVTMKCAAGGE